MDVELVSLLLDVCLLLFLSFVGLGNSRGKVRVACLFLCLGVEEVPSSSLNDNVGVGLDDSAIVRNRLAILQLRVEANLDVAHKAL